MKVKYLTNISSNLHFNIFRLLNDLRNWGLTQSDIRVLAEFYNEDSAMLLSGEIKNYDARMSILFSSEFKKRIMNNLGMSYNTFNNSLSKLRKKGFITEDNSIDERYLLNLKKEQYDFTIVFTNEA